MEIQKKKRLGEILLDAGLINTTQLQDALKEGKEKRLLIGQALLKKGYIKENNLAEALSVQLGYPYIALKELHINQETLDSISENYVKLHKIIPLEKKENILKIGMTDPQDQILISEIIKMTKCTVQPCVCTATDILEAIDKYYGEPGMVGNFLLGSPKKKAVIKTDIIEEYNYTVNDGVKHADQIIEQALARLAGEVHLESLENSLRIRFRTDKTLTEVQTLKNELKQLIISNLKGKGGLDIAVRDRPQKGKFNLFIEGEKVEIFISSIPTKFGENLVLRLVYKERYISELTSLGMEITNVERVRQIFHEKEGIVFISGPPLSGKTTTLYSLLKMINNPHINIFTIEDQVECTIEGINQVELHPERGLTLESAVTSILSHNPDILIFDTSMNKKTAESIFHAALTKCMVISVINLKNTFDLFSLLSCLGIDQYTSVGAIKAIIGQKMFNAVCQNCKEELHLSPDGINERPSRFKDITSYYKGRGCFKCGNTGSDSCMSIFEVLIISQEIKEKMLEGINPDQLKRLYKKNGLKTISDKIIEKIKEGLITIDKQ